ncbi:NAD(P)/FAD-dependent oxidoreductase [Svornostia abyssi]|uniref:NAD(P)/FAD-dependent oxidoreductase n=1 Tax=Svornostia abyssi TaxID=2898438 RepID=A0ABY5PH13_9ACTN|nr:NAD(P)/FAD-dependent oxidoreductase [Parviterribacteraceae bacterium J379]
MGAEDLGLVVIVGGGIAAVRAAERLAERGFTGRVDIVAAEPGPPYRRPLLTSVASGRLDASQLQLSPRLPARTRWRGGRRATGLDPDARRVFLDDGRALPYDGLIIATGAVPRTLPGARRANDRVHTLRTLDDAHRLARGLRDARRLLIVGGGTIGCEAAAALRNRGLPTTLVELGPALLGDVVGPRMGEAFTVWHRRHRVDVRCSVGVATWDQHRAGVRAELTDGAVVEADVALVAVGAWPDVGWLADSGFDLGDGVLCGPTTHVVGAEDVVAAGDCARWPNLRFDESPRRVGHSANATAMGRHAADALLDGVEATAPFTPIPWGFTEQFGACTQLVGRPSAGVSFVDVEGRPSVMRGAVAAFDGRGRFVGGTIAGARPAARWVHDAVAASCPAPPSMPRVSWDPEPHLRPRPSAARVDDRVQQAHRVEQMPAWPGPPRRAEDRSAGGEQPRGALH